MNEQKTFAVQLHGNTPACDLCKDVLRWDDEVNEFVDSFDSITCRFLDHQDIHQPGVL